MNHPTAEELALLAGQELGAWKKMTVGLHVRHCPHCARELAAMSAARKQLKDAALELPAGLDWRRLSLEMQANIRLGLAAGAIAEGAWSDHRQAPGDEVWPWKLGVVAASLSFVLAAGFLLEPGAGVRQPSRPTAQVMLETNGEGLAVQQRGSALTLLTPASTPVVTTVSWDGGARASYVDSETGQVTIHHVAAQ